MKKILICAGATLAYWAVILLGPFIIYIADFLMAALSPAGWNQNGFYAQFISPIIAQALACYLAYLSARYICKNDHPFCVLANCIIGACACCAFAFLGKTARPLIAMLVSAVICIATAVVQARSIHQEQ